MINSDRGHAIMGHGRGMWRLHVPQTRVATVFATQQQLALSAGEPELTQFVSACHLIMQRGGRRLQPGEEMVANLRGSCLKRHGRRAMTWNTTGRVSPTTAPLGSSAVFSPGYHRDLIVFTQRLYVKLVMGGVSRHAARLAELQYHRN